MTLPASVILPKLFKARLPVVVMLVVLPTVVTVYPEFSVNDTVPVLPARLVIALALSVKV